MASRNGGIANNINNIARTERIASNNISTGANSMYQQ